MTTISGTISREGRNLAAIGEGRVAGTGRSRPERDDLTAPYKVAGIGGELEDVVIRSDPKAPGSPFKAKLAEAVLDAPLKRTITGASELSFTVHDPLYTLLRSKMLEERPLIELDGLKFRLESIEKQQKDLTLTFMDEKVYKLRQFTGPKKAYRGKVTRAEFVLSLVREALGANTPFFIPELHKKQPIRAVRDKAVRERQAPDTERGSNVAGFTKNDVGKIPLEDVGGNIVQADLVQVHNIDVVLDTGASLGAPYKVLLAAVCGGMIESFFRNLGAGASDRDSHGIFQQRPSAGWNSSTDVVVQSREFYLGLGEDGNGAISVYKQNPNASVGTIVQTVQNSGYPDRYDTVKDTAKKVLDAWLGGGAVPTSGGDIPDTVVTTIKPYAFEVKKKEHYWKAIQRLAKEVRWRAFFVGPVFFFISEDDLYKMRVRYNLTEGAPGVENIDFDFDMRMTVAEATIDARAKHWAAPPGTIVRIDDLGPADGRYLIESIESNLVAGTGKGVTVNARMPMDPLPEPAAKRVSRTIPGQDAPEGTAVAGPEKYQIIVQEATRISKLAKPYLWGGGHGSTTSANGPWDCSGAVSRVMDVAGLLPGGTPVVSGAMAGMWQPGEGEFVTIYANGEHVLMKIGNNFWGTSGQNPGGGAGWIPGDYYDAGYLSDKSARHPAGL